jgi:hypothetical protein
VEMRKAYGVELQDRDHGCVVNRLGEGPGKEHSIPP